MNLAPFKNLIKERCGLTFEDDKSTTLRKGIRDRMSSKGAVSHTEYFNHLFNDHDEFHRLVNLLTINETYFLREYAHYRLLSERIIPELLDKVNKGQKINIFSAGCSTGEEPYSLVIRLIEKYGRGSNHFFSVTAGDIDRNVIDTARKGVFTKKSFRKFDNDLKKKYFKKVGDERYEIMDFIKERVEFQNINLLSESYPDSLQGMDIIFYRNVSIYFEHETQKRIFLKLSQILNDNGYLIVSSTETFFHNIGILSLIEMDGTFLYKKNLALNIEDRRKIPKRIEDCKLPIEVLPIATTHLENLKENIVSTRATKKKQTQTLEKITKKRPKPKISTTKKPPVQRNMDSHKLFDEALSLAKSKQYKEALNCINTLLSEYTGFIKAYSLKVSIMINLQRLEEAKEISLKTIEMDQWNLEGYLLLGLIANIENNEDETVKRFKEALYIQPSCWLAHFYLAGAYNSRNELAQAYKEYRITLNLLENGNVSDHGLTYFPLMFPTEQMIHLCCHNITQLRKRLE